jgi:hypothetical protein
MGDDTTGTTPHEQAEVDAANAERMRGLEEAHQNVAHGFDVLDQTFANLGWEAASENAEASADAEHSAAVKAKYSAEAYEGASQAWTHVDHDLSEQAKLTGQGFVASSTASEAHHTLTSAQGMSDEQRTGLELLAAREDASVPVFGERAAAMGAEAVQDMNHAHALEESARLGDPESGLTPE